MTAVPLRLSDERGTSLVELLVVCVLLSIVTVAIVSGMTSIVGATASAEQRTAGIQDARTALEVLERDIRAANPIDALPAGTPVSTYDSSISFSLHCSPAGAGTCGSDSLRSVSYRVTGNRFERIEGGVTRLLVGPSGPTSVPTTSQRGAVVNPTSRPVFRYVAADGDVLQTSGTGAAPSSQFRDCVHEVRIRLEVVTESGKQPLPTVELETTATIRNYHEVAGC